MADEAATLPLAVSMGEPAGIGTEVLLKSYAQLSQAGSSAPVFFLIDDPARVARIVREIRAPFRVTTIEDPAGARDAFSQGLPVLPLRGIDPASLAHVTPGQPSAATAAAVTGSIRQAVELALEGSAGGVVTLPIQKSVLSEAGFPHPGHTEFLGELTAEADLPAGMPRGPVMMLAAGDFRTVPATVHRALKDVPASLKADELVRIGTIVARSLSYDFGIQAPRLAIAGLNPHAGEGGLMGMEEQETIAPAIQALRSQNIDATGPWPADTMFHAEARAQYHAAIAMYHDQALIPIKTVAFHDAVNVTLGLPIVRTSPDHGTALQIAGKGVARADSTSAAILMAARMAYSRALHAG
ncbi:4-hydroxythreonine-4-phosphate dehydrogenase PdxA [Parvularcula sp. ZS-1/3]|uniref:4-hydroxythreonine-4-phosphate dehydrogenase n=1 Tax=Parvularcula mediterranea TaxID=2732508 RepID=A0A7Y3W5T2_9PROT|nr:4-hydroxythreonine-4-phosphate dehydrogenase PdxA [Parvularcula mediterranea]NNU16672.1 4-hydroxythreonine-4-phosphate dehydrogenase PdxA [Parvularcula mediterranea]